MSVNENNSTKFHVGKFSVTDQNGALVISAKVEMTNEYVEGVFWMDIHPFDKESNHISVLFDVVSLRAFANQLKELQYKSVESVKKFSGGKKMVKSLTVSVIEEYSSFEFKQDKTMLYFRLPVTNLTGLAMQIEHLVDATMDATYKTQQFVEKKKLK